MASGEIDAGLAAMERLAAAPQADPALLWLYGESLRNAGRPRSAADVFHRLVARESRSFAFRLALADALLAAGSVGEAIEVARAAVALSPRDIRARLLLTDTLGRADLWPEALAVAEEARMVAPEDAETALRIGRAALALGRVDDAGRAFERVLYLAPRHPEARAGLGRVALRRGQLQRAIDLLGEALAETPEDRALRLDLYTALRRADLVVEARRLVSPEVTGLNAADDIRVAAARLALADGRWREAFADFDRRPTAPPSDRPRWDGSRAPAGRLLVTTEPAECDFLAFGRLLPMLAERVLTLTLAAPGAVLDQLAPFADLIGRPAVADIAAPPEHDFWLPLASAPAALGLTPDAVPPPLATRVACPAVPDGAVMSPVIGLALAPSPWSPVAEPVPADVVTSLRAAFPLARFVALDAAAGAAIGEAPSADPAAGLAELDIVVASDGPLAHVAGSRGLPLWLLLDSAPHWMWGRTGRFSRWYPSARLFRAKGPDWQGVAEALFAEVMPLALPGLADATALRRLSETAERVGGAAAARAALPYASRLVMLDPANGAAVAHLVDLLLRVGDIDDADRVLAAGLAMAPRHGPLLRLSARRLIEHGEAAAALREADAALAVTPDDIEIQVIRAEALSALGDPLRAEFALRQAVQKAPRSAELLTAWGRMLARSGDHRGATRAFERAAIAADSADARLGLGQLGAAAGETTLARHFLRSAVALDPGHVEAATSLARVLADGGRVDDAIDVLRQLIDLRPAAAPAHALLGELLLSRGDFAAGLSEHEWRHGAPSPLPEFGDIAGRTVTLTAEGGAAVLLRLLRLLPRLKAAGAVKVRLAGSGELAPLLGDFAGEAAPGDITLPLLSLPALLALTPADLEAPRRYLAVDPAAITDAARPLADVEGFRVGLAAAGMTELDLAPLQALDGVTLLPLDAEATALLPGPRTVGDGTLSGIAPALANLDAVIADAGNAVTALAGAMGRPALALGPARPDWLWLEAGGRTPWFPETRLFPPRQGDRQGALSRLSTVLAALAGGDRSAHLRPEPPAVPTETDAADNTEALVRAGLAALDSRDDHRAILLIGDALAAGADDPTLRDRRAAALLRIGERDRAGDELTALVEAAPTAERLTDLSEIDRLAGRAQFALERAEQAVRLRPDLHRSHRALARALMSLGRVDAALAAFARAVELASGDPELKLEQAEALLAAGDYPAGFAGYQIRWQAAQFLPRRFDVPRWTGEDIAGRRLLVHADLGLGPQIALARYLPLIAERGAEVIVEVRSALTDLYRRLDLSGNVTVVEQGRRLPAHDLEVPLAGLPHVFGSRRDGLPPPAQLRPDPLRVDAWQRQIGDDGRLRVGLYWRDGDDAACLKPLFDLSGVHLVALDRNESRANLADLGGDAVTSLGGRLFGFVETAAVLSVLDLVIAPPSATAHLAATLARPTIVVGAEPADWLWAGDGERSAWYPSARCLRRGSGDIAARLVDLVRERLTP